MKVSQVCVSSRLEPHHCQALSAIAPDLVLVFGAHRRLLQPDLLEVLTRALPAAELVGCSTAGEISQQGVTDDHLVLIALAFEHPGVSAATTDLADLTDSRAAGQRLGRSLARDQLHHVLVLGQGVAINGSALIEGLYDTLSASVQISGGLAADGGAFSGTLTLSRAGVSAQQIVAVGFDSPRLKISHGCFHGWKPFGPARKVTRSVGNWLYELDGQPALQLYRRYLGEHSRGLPASGLLFPFEMLGGDFIGHGLIRTILGMDEASGGLLLAGDIDPKGFLRLMHANADALVEGAEAAAEATLDDLKGTGDVLSLLVSCVGRKLVMGERVEEEVEAVAAVHGGRDKIAGFYSNGEIGPARFGRPCELHNQTMTITRFEEVAADAV